MSKTYLGDGVYAEFDGFAIKLTTEKLTTENGVSVTNRIFLEPEVLRALEHFVKKLRNQHNENNPRLDA